MDAWNYLSSSQWETSIPGLRLVQGKRARVRHHLGRRRLLSATKRHSGFKAIANLISKHWLFCNFITLFLDVNMISLTFRRLFDKETLEVGGAVPLTAPASAQTGPQRYSNPCLQRLNKRHLVASVKKTVLTPFYAVLIVWHLLSPRFRGNTLLPNTHCCHWLADCPWLWIGERNPQSVGQSGDLDTAVGTASSENSRHLITFH